jgi:hypothetical protein
MLETTSPLVNSYACAGSRLTMSSMFLATTSTFGGDLARAAVADHVAATIAAAAMSDNLDIGFLPTLPCKHQPWR